jgi:hypothetical protein
MIEVITMLVNILKGNTYSEGLKIMGQLEDADEYRISLNLNPQKDQRNYNLSVASEVAAVRVEGQGLLKQFDGGICLHGKDQQITRIQSCNASYGPLSYPLFFPRGEPGWYADIPKTKFKYEDVLVESATRKTRSSHDASGG